MTLSIASPDRETPRPVAIRSNLGEWAEDVAPETSFEPQVVVCVPPDRPGRVTIETPATSLVYPDPTKTAPGGRIDRSVGVLLRSVALADETAPLERCRS